MVGNTDTSQPQSNRRADWVAIHSAWRQGQAAEKLAEEFKLQPETIISRCRWIDQHFPPVTPTRVMADLARRLDEAQQALEGGDLAEAERLAKAVTALIRAGRALDDWNKDMNEDASKRTGACDNEDIAIEHKDYRAELESRLDRLAAHLKTQGITRPDQLPSDTGLDPRLGDLGPS